MSATEGNPVVKKFGAGERSVPHHSQKAKKWYSTSDDPAPKKVSSVFHEEREPWQAPCRCTSLAQIGASVLFIPIPPVY
jgi:hypothetical protein